jgi:hypothetical protein
MVAGRYSRLPLAVQTQRRAASILAHVQRDRPAHEAAVEKFVDAVIAFSDNPGAGTLQEYLEASIALEDLRHAEQATGTPLSLPAA